MSLEPTVEYIRLSTVCYDKDMQDDIYTGDNREERDSNDAEALRNANFWGVDARKINGIRSGITVFDH